MKFSTKFLTLIKFQWHCHVMYKPFYIYLIWNAQIFLHIIFSWQIHKISYFPLTAHKIPWLWIKQIRTLTFGPPHQKTCLPGFANSKSADQPAHLRRLISTFVIHLLESIISRLATSKISIFLANLCSWAGWFESHIIGNPKDKFSWFKAHFMMCMNPVIPGIFITILGRGPRSFRLGKVVW